MCLIVIRFILKTGMGNEGAPNKEKGGDNPELARRLSEKNFGAVTRAHIFWFLSGGVEFEISDEMLKVVQERCVRIGVYLIEAARHSPLMECKGDYECAAKSLRLRAHEVLHAAIAWKIHRNPVPSFLKAESQVNAPDLIVEEMYALLGYSFHGSNTLFKNPPDDGGEDGKEKEIDFETAESNQLVSSYFILKTIVYDEYRKENPKATGEEIKAVMEEFDDVWEQASIRVGQDFYDLMRLIYDNARKEPPRRDTLLVWFLETTGDIPEYSYPATP